VGGDCGCGVVGSLCVVLGGDGWETLRLFWKQEIMDGGKEPWDEIICDQITYNQDFGV